MCKSLNFLVQYLAHAIQQTIPKIRIRIFQDFSGFFPIIFYKHWNHLVQKTNKGLRKKKSGFLVLELFAFKRYHTTLNINLFQTILHLWRGRWSKWKKSRPFDASLRPEIRPQLSPGNCCKWQRAFRYSQIWV